MVTVSAARLPAAPRTEPMLVLILWCRYLDQEPFHHLRSGWPDNFRVRQSRPMILLGRSPGPARLHRLLPAQRLDGDESDSQGERTMYCNFLGLRCLPFEDRTDTRFLSLSSNNERLLEALEREAHQGRGVTPVFGDAGSGKTLLTRALVARLHASDHVVVVTCPRSPV